METLLTKTFITILLIISFSGCISFGEMEVPLPISFNRLNASVRIMSFERSEKINEIKKILTINHKRPIDYIYCFNLKDCGKYSDIDYLIFSETKSFKKHKSIREKNHNSFRINLDIATNMDKLIESVENAKLRKYNEALNKWKGAEDIVNWLSLNITYDVERSVYIKKLADKIKLLVVQNEETNKYNNEFFSYRAQDFLAYKKGVCLDVARFGVSSLNKIDPNLNARFLKIKHVGIKKDGIIRVSHVMAIYKKQDEFFIFADSKKMDRHSGPYKDIHTFITIYEKFLGQKIKSYKVIDTLAGDELDKAI